MEGPFDFLEQFSDVVEVEPRPQSQIASLDLEGRYSFHLPLGVEPQTQHAVHDLLEGLSGLLCFGSKFHCHIIVEGQCCAHILMLQSPASRCQGYE